MTSNADIKTRVEARMHVYAVAEEAALKMAYTFERGTPAHDEAMRISASLGKRCMNAAKQYHKEKRK